MISHDTVPIFSLRPPGLWWSLVCGEKGALTAGSASAVLFQPGCATQQLLPGAVGDIDASVLQQGAKQLTAGAPCAHLATGSVDLGAGSSEKEHCCALERRRPGVSPARSCLVDYTCDAGGLDEASRPHAAGAVGDAATAMSSARRPCTSTRSSATLRSRPC